MVISSESLKERLEYQAAIYPQLDKHSTLAIERIKELEHALREVLTTELKPGCSPSLPEKVITDAQTILNK